MHAVIGQLEFNFHSNNLAPWVFASGDNNLHKVMAKSMAEDIGEDGLCFCLADIDECTGAKFEALVMGELILFWMMLLNSSIVFYVAQCWLVPCRCLGCFGLCLLVWWLQSYSLYPFYRASWVLLILFCTLVIPSCDIASSRSDNLSFLPDYSSCQSEPDARICLRRSQFRWFKFKRRGLRVWDGSKFRATS